MQINTKTKENRKGAIPVTNPLNKERRKKMAQHTKKKRYEPKKDLAEMSNPFLFSELYIVFLTYNLD